MDVRRLNGSDMIIEDGVPKRDPWQPLVDTFSDDQKRLYENLTMNYRLNCDERMNRYRVNGHLDEDSVAFVIECRDREIKGLKSKLGL